MKKIILICLSLVACSQQKIVTVTEKKLAPYQLSMENSHPFDTPYVAFFQREEKHLYFIAAEHIAVLGRAPILQHPTLRTIEKVFAEVRPDLVIVEGISTGMEMDPKSVVNMALECKEVAYEKGCGESAFAINQAAALGSHYMSGEPAQEEIKERVFKAGFTELDLLAFSVLRQIPQLKRQGEWQEAKKKVIVQDYLERYSTELKIERAYRFHEFDQWYRAHRIGLKNWNEVTASDCAPHGEGDATYVQKISHQIGIIRDQILSQRIDWALARFDKVLVVFGGSHYVTLRPALVEAMGEPREVKKF